MGQFACALLADVAGLNPVGAPCQRMGGYWDLCCRVALIGEFGCLVG